jgi:hypothetical protein
VILRVEVRAYPAARSSFFHSKKTPDNSGDYVKLRKVREKIPGPYRVIIFPSPDCLVRRHPVRVAESCVRSCNSADNPVITTHC